MNTFIYKIINKLSKVSHSFDISFIERDYSRANSAQQIVKVPDIKTSFGRSSLSYCIPKFINEILRNSHNLSFLEFKKSVFSNLDILYSSFLDKCNLFV